MPFLWKTRSNIRTRTSAPRTTSGATATRHAPRPLPRLSANHINQTLFWNDKVNYHKKDE